MLTQVIGVVVSNFENQNHNICMLWEYIKKIKNKKFPSLVFTWTRRPIPIVYIVESIMMSILKHTFQSHHNTCLFDVCWLQALPYTIQIQMFHNDGWPFHWCVGLSYYSLFNFPLYSFFPQFSRICSSHYLFKEIALFTTKCC